MCFNGNNIKANPENSQIMFIRIYVAVMGVGSQQNTYVQFISFIGEHPLRGGT